MSFLDFTKLLVLNLLIVSIFCSCSKLTVPRKNLYNKGEILQNTKLSPNIYKEKIKRLKDFNIESIVFFLYGEQVEYKKYVEKPLFDKLSYAITVQSKPFTSNKLRQDAAAECMAYGRLVLYSKKCKMTIDICDDMFFWERKRQLKYAFISKELTKLVIDEIQKIKNQEDDINCIIKVLQKNIRSTKKTDSKDKK